MCVCVYIAVAAQKHQSAKNQSVCILSLVAVTCQRPAHKKKSLHTQRIIEAFNSSTLKENKKMQQCSFSSTTAICISVTESHDPDVYVCVCCRVRPIALTLLTGGPVGAEHFQ